MKKFFIFILLCLSAVLTKAQIKKRVLFIGNSYTYVNDLPQLVANIALSKTDSLIFDSSTPGGSTFYSHCNNSVTMQKIRSQNWDVVILQGQSQEPSIDPSQVLINTYPYAKQLCDSIRSVNPCIEIMFFMTWGRKNGDISNCATYSPVCTYDGMQSRLRESYMMFKDSFLTSVGPVGVAWKNFRAAYPLVDLYMADESHPSMQGSYLAACVFYSSIFNKTTVGSSYNPSLSPVEVTNIQSIASQTVLDSTEVWNLNSAKPKAAFSYSITPPFTCQFINNSNNSTSNYWSFGSTLQNPSYTFPGAGTYTIQLKVSNQCTSDSLSQIISFTGIQNIPSEDKNFSIGISSQILFIRPKNYEEDFSFFIYDISGQQIFKSVKNRGPYELNLSNFSQGMYLLKIETSKSIILKKIITPIN